MASNSTIVPLIRTKLHRPPVLPEHVHRTRLTDPQFTLAETKALLEQAVGNALENDSL